MMRLGVSLRSGFAGVPAGEGARWMVERSRAASAAGLDSLYLGDHHVSPQAYYQGVPMLGAMLGDWGGRTTGLLFQLPLWHPVLVAEQVGTLAALADGPFVLIAALGGWDRQFRGMGCDLSRRVVEFESRLAVIRDLLAGRTVSAGPPLDLEGARIEPLPPDPVAVWIAASASRAIDRAARLGDGWVGRPDMSGQDALDQLSAYRSSCEEHGTAGVAALRRDVHVVGGSSERAAVEQVAATRYAASPDAPIVGEVDEVVEALVAWQRAGFDEVMLRHFVDDQEAVLESLGRLAVVRRRLADAGD